MTFGGTKVGENSAKKVTFGGEKVTFGENQRRNAEEECRRGVQKRSAEKTAEEECRKGDLRRSAEKTVNPHTLDTPRAPPGPERMYWTLGSPGLPGQRAQSDRDRAPPWRDRGLRGPGRDPWDPGAGSLGPDCPPLAGTSF